MKRAAAAAAAAAATTAAAEAVVATPLPSGLPPLPSCGSKHFAIGTVPVREKQRDLFVVPDQHGWVSPHVYLQPSVARIVTTVATEGASVTTAAGARVAGAADGGVEETKGEQSTRQAEAAMKRAAEGAAAAPAAAAATAAAVMAPPLPAGSPPLPACDTVHFDVGMAPRREQRGGAALRATAGKQGWVSPHIYL